jgi:hypothetical protein
MFNFILNTSFYPRLLKYELGVSAVAFINQNKLPKNHAFLPAMELSEKRKFQGISEIGPANSYHDCDAGV